MGGRQSEGASWVGRGHLCRNPAHFWARHGPRRSGPLQGIKVRQRASDCLCRKLRRAWVQGAAEAWVGPPVSVCRCWLPWDCSYQDLQKTIYSKTLKRLPWPRTYGWRNHTAEQTREQGGSPGAWWMSHKSQKGQPFADIGPAGKGKLLKRSISIFTDQMTKGEFGIESVTDERVASSSPPAPLTVTLMKHFLGPCQGSM